VARDTRAADLAERETLVALASGLERAGLPIASSGVARPRPRISFAAPLPRGATADADLVEVFLAERLPVAEVRRRILAGLPDGVYLIAIEDEWVGAPSLASRVAAVRYRVEVRADGPCPPPTTEAAGTVQVGDWDAGQGRGTLFVRVERDESGRLAAPAGIIERVGLPLRVLGVNRVAVELAGEGAGARLSL
jgi:Uncharacterized protein conserved in bacteria (DUF2344)